MELIKKYKGYRIYFDKDEKIDEARAWVDARPPAARSENLNCRESVVDDDPVYNEGWTISAQKQAE